MQVGTLSGNPVAAVAGLATLEVLKRPGAYEQVYATGRDADGGHRRGASTRGLPAQVIGAPVMFDVLFTDRPVQDYRGVLRADAGLPPADPGGPGTRRAQKRQQELRVTRSYREGCSPDVGSVCRSGRGGGAASRK